MTNIQVFQTHIEVSPYKKGDFPQLEKFYSIFIKNRGRMFYAPFCYTIKNQILYLPKGANILTLENKFGVNATYHRYPDIFDNMSNWYNLYTNPRIDQSEAISFLSGEGNFGYTRSLSQLVLQLPTGAGKTYVCIAAMIKLHIKSGIIVYRDILVDHWINEIRKHTDIPENKIIIVKGKKIMEDVVSGKVQGDIYIIMHQTISSASRINGDDFVKSFFKASKIGIKFVDETHEYLQSTIRLDMYSNIYKNVYISGTFSRSNYKEKQIMKSAFSSAAVYGNSDMKLPNEKRHVIYIQAIYKSGLDEQYILGMKNGYGFSAYKFINFSLQFDKHQSILYTIFSIVDRHVIENPHDYPGQILIVSASKQSVRTLHDILKVRYHEICSVGMIFSDVKEEDKIKESGKHIICSTIKSCGAGFNAPIQTVICAEPHTSQIITSQLKGRLDRFDAGKLTYFYDLIDKSIPYFDDIQRIHLSTMKNYAKEVKTEFF